MNRSRKILILVSFITVAIMPTEFNAAEAHPVCAGGSGDCYLIYTQFQNMVLSVAILLAVAGIVTIFAIKTLTRPPKVGYC